MQETNRSSLNQLFNSGTNLNDQGNPESSLSAIFTQVNQFTPDLSQASHVSRFLIFIILARNSFDDSVYVSQDDQEDGKKELRKI
jgi:hypothetical protein